MALFSFKVSLSRSVVCEFLHWSGDLLAEADFAAKRLSNMCSRRKSEDAEEQKAIGVEDCQRNLWGKGKKFEEKEELDFFLSFRLSIQVFKFA
jgi:hypothetical protein